MLSVTVKSTLLNAVMLGVVVLNVVMLSVVGPFVRIIIVLVLA